jgi:hypothetical protein
MSILKRIIFGNALLMFGVASASAADLPSNKSAPVEYVRVCDAFGSGFFFIPGTDTCLKVGGLVLGEVRGFNPSYSIAGTGFYANGIGQGHSATSNAYSGAVSAGSGYIPSASQYTNARSRDATAFSALGRVELDTRTGTDWGTLRSFLRVDAYYGSGSNAATGANSSLSNTFNTTAGSSAPRETTILNRAFIQFAGLTAGRAQSAFDFYADAYNYVPLRGSNATVALLSYTASFGSGFSATLSAEDQSSRRTYMGSTIAGGYNAAFAQQAVTVGGISSTSFQANPAGSRVPEIVGNIRVEQPWGAAQISAAAHQVDASLFAAGALATPGTSYAQPALTTNSYGFAVQGGLQLNVPYLAPGDKLWLQAAYEKGAFGYIAGNNLANSYGPVNQNRYMGSGFNPMEYSYGWNPQAGGDCIFTASGTCEQQSGWDITGAFKHYWISSLSSALFGSYMQLDYSNNALAGFGGAVGVSNLKETRIGTNLIWTPVKNFDIGTEFDWVHLDQSRPAGLAPNATLNSAGLPSFQSNTNEFEGRIRVQRAF